VFLGQRGNFGSNHPGGANFLFADGSVHFIKETINRWAYFGICTRNEGETLSSDSY
jgi:prepilin-type processing-associated H-X9-DG protein